MPPSNKTVIHLASDLMLGSTVSSHAARCGVKFRSVGTSAQVCGDSGVDEPLLLLIDLGLPGLDSRLLPNTVPAHILSSAVAYGPHVHTAKLEAARAAGIGSVMSRGEFSAKAQQLIADFAAVDENAG